MSTSVRKMMLVEPSQQYERQAMKEYTMRLDNEMQKILADTSVTSEEEKLKRYLLVLKRFIDAGRKLQEIHPIPVRIVGGREEEKEEGDDDVFGSPATADLATVPADPVVVTPPAPTLIPEPSIIIEPLPVPKAPLRPQAVAAPSASEHRIVTRQRTLERDWGDSYTDEAIVKNIHNAENKAHASSILKQLKTKDWKLDIHPSGELVVSGKLKRDTNIVDILRYHLYTERYRGDKPSGYDEFNRVVSTFPIPKQAGRGLTRKWCRY